jgi:hypothetical protein
LGHFYLKRFDHNFSLGGVSMRFFRLQNPALALTISAVMLMGSAVSVLNLTPAANAQSLLAGDVVGTVTDPSGAAVSNAIVKAVSKETQQTISVVTSPTGAYRISLLKPGLYAFTVSGPGFKETATTVSVATGQVTTQNIQLTLGAASETVEVSAGSQLLQTDSADLSTQFDLQQLQNVPNPRRRYYLCGPDRARRRDGYWRRIRQLLGLRPSRNVEQLYDERDAGQRSLPQPE